MANSPTRNVPAPQPPSLKTVWRAVASSTALETGASVQQLEKKLKSPSEQRFSHVKLAS